MSTPGTQWRGSWLVGLVLLLLAPGCGALPQPAPATAVPTATLEPTATPLPPVVTPSPEAAPVANLVLQDASQRLGVPVDQLRLERLDPRQWPDSALGCPQPGLLYSQIVTPGYIMLVAGAGKQLEYHTDMHTHIALCQQTP